LELLQRDQEAFRKYWLITQCEERVEYHLGLNFAKDGKGVVICDEADELIFDNPGNFKKSTQQCKVIALTATPDNGNALGLENAVLKALNFSIFESCKSGSRFGFDNTAPISENLSELVSLKATASPIIVHCSEA
jgi:hypothetical protein